MDTTKQPRHIVFNAKFIKAIKESPENPYDIHIKGLLYDKLKKQRDELLEALKSALPYLPSGSQPFQMGFIGQEAKQLIKNCEND